VGLWLIGVPNAVLWGILAGLMRFVPFVGSFIAAFFPIVLAAAVVRCRSAVPASRRKRSRRSSLCSRRKTRKRTANALVAKGDCGSLTPTLIPGTSCGLLVDIKNPPSHYGDLSAELLIKVRARGRSLVEVGTPHHPRTAGQASGANPRVVLRAVRDFWRLRLRLWFRRSAAMEQGEPVLGEA